MSDFIFTVKTNLRETIDHLRYVIKKTEETHAAVIQFDLANQIARSEELAHMSHLLKQAVDKHVSFFCTRYEKHDKATIEQCLAEHHDDRELHGLVSTFRALNSDFEVKLERLIANNTAAKEHVDSAMEGFGVEKQDPNKNKRKNTFYGR
ncbi:hypothetical protein [Vibrio sp. D431a]|uniref:hypothetical protein n=1 Tax=Vibrio sp. D431a TaxID=2837388 RepID=UPI0025521746|nr:hypothetical protein [Vibrio sp. D431a]MDK9793914.1 hypothetical protein [Vibrio sp. D431a]